MSKPVRALLIGAAGRMGKTIVDLAESDPNIDIVAQCDLGDPIEAAMKQCDVAIDFSNAAANDEICAAALKHRTALVIGTTGYSFEQRELIEKTAQSLPIVYTSNFSVGVNVLFAITKKAAEILGGSFDLEITEAHHTNKKDAPSGTAKTLAEILKETRRDLKEIVILSIREGEIVGDHTVIFKGSGERLEITHRASSREIFARGALRAAKWVIGKSPGLYSMQDVLGL